MTTPQQAYTFCRAAGIEMLKMMISDASDPGRRCLLEERLSAVRDLPVSVEVFA